MKRVYNIYSEYEPEVKLVGKIHEDERKNLIVEVLVPDDYNCFPPDLLGLNRDWEKDDTAQTRHWLETRVVPKTRQFLREMLDAQKLPEWDLVTLLKLNKGRVWDDKFYIEIEENTDACESFI